MTCSCDRVAELDSGTSFLGEWWEQGIGHLETVQELWLAPEHGLKSSCGCDSGECFEDLKLEQVVEPRAAVSLVIDFDCHFVYL